MKFGDSRGYDNCIHPAVIKGEICNDGYGGRNDCRPRANGGAYTLRAALARYIHRIIRGFYLCVFFNVNNNTKIIIFFK